MAETQAVQVNEGLRIEDPDNRDAWLRAPNEDVREARQ